MVDSQKNPQNVTYPLKLRIFHNNKPPRVN